MRFLLDTDTCISILRSSDSRATKTLSTCEPDEVVVCTIVLGELLYGAKRSSKPVENTAHVNSFAEAFASLPFDISAAVVYAETRADLAQKGTPIGPNDLLIASIARSRGLTVVTHNVREFERVAGLDVEDWQ